MCQKGTKVDQNAGAQKKKKQKEISAKQKTRAPAERVFGCGDRARQSNENVIQALIKIGQIEANQQWAWLAARTVLHFYLLRKRHLKQFESRRQDIRLQNVAKLKDFAIVWVIYVAVAIKL